MTMMTTTMMIMNLGRDDFNFSSWIFSASSHIAPVTERNTLDFSGYGVGGLLYPPRTLPMWQNSFQECKNGFFGFPLLKSDLMLAIFTKTSSVTIGNVSLGNLPRETLWIGWIRSWGWPTPPTSAHIVTEMTLTGRKTSNLAGCAPSMSKTLWNTLCGLLSKHWCHNNGHSLFNLARRLK